MGTDKTALGDRMKLYEKVHSSALTPRMPLIIRVDGVAFHSLTKGFERPFDCRISDSMNAAAQALCKRIQGACFAYVQSDEISILIVDYKNLNSHSWFNKKLQKVVSVSAGIASSTFTTHLREVEQAERIAAFDSRVIQIPREDVENYFLWRQKDCIRNSILSLGQANFSHPTLQGKDRHQIKDMLLDEKRIDWELDIPDYQQYGFIVKRVVSKSMAKNPKTEEMVPMTRSSWDVLSAPDFSTDPVRNMVREYVNQDVREDDE